MHFLNVQLFHPIRRSMTNSSKKGYLFVLTYTFQPKGIPGAGHDFNAQQIEDFMPDVDAFIKQQLKAE